MDLSKRYFGKGAPLREELDLFRAVLDTKVKSRHSAQKLLGEVVRNASKINSRKLNEEKNRLIKEINYNLCNDKFYDHKISNYTIYASMHSLMCEKRSKKKALSSIDKIKLEDSVVEFLVKEGNSKASSLRIDPNYNNAVYKLVVDRFHKKYKEKLSENQKKLLVKYILSEISQDKEGLKKEILTEAKVIREKITNISDTEILRDQSLADKLKECYKKFSNVDLNDIGESTILEILQYMRLAEEVSS